MIITIKPHHLLDVYKLYGRGIYPFSPDLEFEHDFYLIANLLLDCKVDSVILTTNSDDMCKPCKYHKNGTCIDSLDIGDFDSKDLYNKAIDSKLLKHFELSENIVYDLNSLLILILEKSSLDLFYKVWNLLPIDDAKARYTDTLNGLKKHLQL